MMIKHVALKKSFVTGVLLLSATANASDCEQYEVYVLRHLPKQIAEHKDPPLNERGRQMAVKLSQMPFMQDIAAGFATPYLRTQMTVRPAAEQHQFEVKTYQPLDTEYLWQMANQQFCGQSIVIIGHSNTVPQIVTALGGEFAVSFAGQPLSRDTLVQLAETDYGTVFHVKKEQGKISQSLLTIPE